MTMITLDQYQKTKGHYESEDIFRRIFHFNPVGMVIFRISDGLTLDANEAFCRMLGHEQQNLLEKTADSLNLWESNHTWKLWLTKLQKQQGSIRDTELNVFNHAGEARTWLVSMQLLQYQANECLIFSAQDITDRKRAETQRLEDARRLRAAVHAAGVGLWEQNLQTDEAYYSPEWKAQLGYADHEINNIFEEWLSRLHPDDMEPTLRTVANYTKDPTPYCSTEFRLRHKDGSYRWIYSQASMLRDEKGTPTYLIGAHIDISAAKRNEHALRQTLQRLALAQKTARCGIWEWNLTTNKLTWTNELFQLFGLDASSSEASLETFYSVIHPDDVAAVKAKAELHQCENRPLIDRFRIVMPSGIEHWIDSWGDVVEDSPEQGTRMLGICIDTTERVQAEQQMRIAAAAFETPVGIMVTNTLGVVVKVNDAFTDIMGFSNTEVLGHLASNFCCRLQDDSFSQALWQTARQKGHWQGEIWDRRKNGEIFPLWFSITAILSSSHGITHFVFSLLDISAQKQAEKVLQDTRQRLEKQIANTNEEVQTLRQETAEVNTALDILLRQRDQDKTELQSALAHDMERAVLPLLKKLQKTNTDPSQTVLLEALNGNLQDLTQSYGRTNTLTSIYRLLTPVEIHVASMVRQGLSSQKIAASLQIARGTVEIHRKHIRKKLGLNSKSSNLQSFLRSLLE